MDNNCRDRISVILFPLAFILSATYRTILFDEQFDDIFDENNGVLRGLNLMKIEANWNWTLFAKEYYFSEYSRRKIDSDGILTEVRSTFNGERYKNVRKNLRFTGHYDKISCPLMISNYNGVKKRAFPDAIGIGFAKSGTGSLAMLSCHPDIVYRDYEPTAFSPKNNFHPTYDSSLPQKSDGEFLIEKSVMYAGTNKTVISGKAKAMKLIGSLMNPNLKIFAFMTDPVSRLFSHINMCIRSKWAFCKNQTLEQVMQKVTNYLSKYNSTEFVETDEMKFGSFHRFIQAGNYALVTGIYQKYFGENVHFVDGLNLLSSETELKLLIQFFGLDSSVMKWRYHPEKNFLCLYKPVKFCLSKNKGSTRDVSSLDYDEELIERYPQLKIWRKAYHDQMVKMYEKIFQCWSQEDCCKRETSGKRPNRIRLAQIDASDNHSERWRWLRKYYCEYDNSH